MNRIFGTFVTGRGALGLLILRVVFGAGLMLHGSGKIAAPFTWMNQMAGDSAPPGILQALAALSEFGGGLALILGLLTPLAAFGIACTMLTAIGMVHLASGHPFVAARGGPSWESPAGYLAVALLMMITGPGSLSLDRLIFGRRSATPDSAMTTDDLARART